MNNNELLLSTIKEKTKNKVEYHQVLKIILNTLNYESTLGTNIVNQVAHDLCDNNIISDELTDDDITLLLNILKNSGQDQIEENIEQIDSIKKLDEETETSENEYEDLKRKYENSLKEINLMRNKLDKLQNVLNLTGRQNIIEVSNEDINGLYSEYLISNKMSFNSAFISVDENGNKIISKTYYQI